MEMGMLWLTVLRLSLGIYLPKVVDIGRYQAQIPRQFSGMVRKITKYI
jgi:hypothetical protein